MYVFTDDNGMVRAQVLVTGPGPSLVFELRSCVFCVLRIHPEHKVAFHEVRSSERHWP